MMKLEHFRRMKEAGQKVGVLTAYDYPTARLLDEAGVDLLLVGDSLGMVVLGYADTTEVTMEEMLHHTRAVCRGGRRAPVVADLPFGSYSTPERAVRNAKKLREAGADAVKLEGGLAQEPQLQALQAAGIAFMGHIGMLPQSVRIEGGYRIKGKTAEQSDSLLADAQAVERAGGFAVVLELVQAEAAARISESIGIPTIGIGSGEGCDGQVLVTTDLIGGFPWFTPKFVHQRADVATEVKRAATEFLRATKGESSPSPANGNGA